MCALAVGALAVGPFLCRTLLPEPAAEPVAGCGFVVVTAGLFLLLVGATIWQLRRHRQQREPELDRRLWEAALGKDEEPRGEDGE